MSEGGVEIIVVNKNFAKNQMNKFTWRPRPLPWDAPSIIPGKSRSWILAPLYSITPGIQVRVVNS